MPINADSPTTLTATFDKWSISNVNIMGSDVADFGQSRVGPVSADATLVKYRVRPDGVSEKSPLLGDRVHIRIDDLNARAASDPTLAQLMNDLITYVVAEAKRQNRIR